ncbi:MULTISPECIES: alpha/beta hydrolase [Comamonas]|uniref:alpha/beta hydrolase n=1 Tax=Comamonas TaxID=283 RepID=UPI00062223C0|nr:MULTISPECIES: alpha/beta hydrolase [Comamonas]KKI14902.1 alpha/beta hydrolase [Comamonas thiooxydans]MDH1252469.1 alpha/beta hydrolase [Comamonas thiooxydans]TYK74013.1 alpha/beta hydrolase [Comamonas sp. Z1]BCX52091.1 alpha/beta hydrolase [Comamonas testosteroni]
MSQPTATTGKPNTLPVVFAHANSFPIGTYRLLFSLLRQRGIEAGGVQRFGHDPKRPVTNHWPHLVDELIEYIEQQVERHGQPVYLVGHSLGGILSFQAASKRPDLARGVLLIDSPLLGGWKANAVGLAKQTQIVASVSPGKISQRRRTTWASNEEALEYFRGKKAFAQWHPQVLQDYVQHGLEDDQDKRSLLFRREVETAIYNTLPSNLNNQLRRHPVRCPVAFIGGRSSVEMRQVGMEMTQRITRGRITMLDGGHLFPMERPEATAAAIEASLLNMEQTILQKSAGSTHK